MRPLDNLIGQKLQSASAEDGEWGLAFSKATLAIYNPIRGTPIEHSVGSEVKAVEFAEREELIINLTTKRR